MPGVKKDIESSLGGSDVQGATASSGKKIGAGLVKAVGGVAIAGIAAAGAVAAVGLGTALVKGFARLDSLDQARAKLTGLGHDAQSVDAIMQNALASVRGTAFGMDAAAGVAGTLVAAGIKPGQDLEKTLKLVADAATIAGTDMGDMGSIFAKVAGTGKLTGEVVAQLGDRGIPVLTKLAEMYGVSTEEAQKMVSAGKVSFEDFASVMEGTLGGAALSSGNTFRGAMANVGASLGRIGAGLLGGVFTKLAPLFQSITVALGPLEATAAAVGEKVGNFLAPAFDKLTGVLNGTVEIGWMSTVATSVSAMSAAFREGDVTSNGLVGVFERIGVAAREVSLGVSAFFAAFREGDVTSSGLVGIFEAFGVVAKSIVDSGVVAYLSPLGLIFQVLQGVLPVVAGALTQVAMTIAGALSTVLPVIVGVLGQVVGLFANLAAQVIPMILPVIVLLADVFGQLLVAVMPIVSTLISALMPILQAIIPVVVSLLGAFMPLITALVTALAPILTVVAQILAAVLQPILSVVIGIVQALGAVITWLVQNVIAPFFQGVVVPIVQNVGNAFKDAFGGLGSFFEGIWRGIQNGFKGFINFIIDGINGFIGNLNGAGNFLSDITGGTISFSVPKIPRLAEGATVLPRRGGTLAVLAEAGRAESVVDTGLMNRALEQGLAGGGSGEATFNIYDVNGVFLGAMRGEIQKADRSSTRSMRGRVSPNG